MDLYFWGTMKMMMQNIIVDQPLLALCCVIGHWHKHALVITDTSTTAKTLSLLSQTVIGIENHSPELFTLYEGYYWYHLESWVVHHRNFANICKMVMSMQLCICSTIIQSCEKASIQTCLMERHIAMTLQCIMRLGMLWKHYYGKSHISCELFFINEDIIL